jgi:DNA-binding HxlR family transcriptional regulator
MEKKDEEKLLKLLGARGTKQILELLSEYGTIQYKQVEEFMSAPTLNKRLHELLTFGLIKHRSKREKGREKGDKLTEKGKKIMKCMEAIIEVAEE